MERRPRTWIWASGMPQDMRLEHDGFFASACWTCLRPTSILRRPSASHHCARWLSSPVPLLPSNHDLRFRLDMSLHLVLLVALVYVLFRRIDAFFLLLKPLSSIPHLPAARRLWATPHPCSLATKRRASPTSSSTPSRIESIQRHLPVCLDPGTRQTSRLNS